MSTAKLIGICAGAVALIGALLLGPPASATEYSRGRHTCTNFEEMKRLYEAYPESMHAQMGYAFCLVLSGRDEEGMRLVQHVADRHNYAYASMFIAEYLEYGGDFLLPTDYRNIDKAIAAYQRTLFFIDLEPRYPFPETEIAEEINQIELRSQFHVPLLYFDKFDAGFFGLYHQYLLTSPSYKGDRDLPTLPEHAPYTQDSLNKLIRFAGRCAGLPKKPHFEPMHYTTYMEACRHLKKTAETLRPLEDRRLLQLVTESCRRDLPKCAKYGKLHKQISDIMKQSYADLKGIFRPLDEMIAKSSR